MVKQHPGRHAKTDELDVVLLSPRSGYDRTRKLVWRGCRGTEATSTECGGRMWDESTRDMEVNGCIARAGGGYSVRCWTGGFRQVWDEQG